MREKCVGRKVEESSCIRHSGERAGGEEGERERGREWRGDWEGRQGREKVPGREREGWRATAGKRREGAKEGSFVI